MLDKYHKVINGKPVATNLAKATTLTKKQKEELKKACNAVSDFCNKLYFK